MRSKRWFAILVTWGVVWPAVATAQASGESPNNAETEGARALFTQGIEAAAVGDDQTAADRFRAAERLRPAPAIEINLATALVSLGSFDEAEELVATVLANPETPDTVRTQASALTDRIRAEGATLSIALEGDSTNTAVRLDERVLPDGRTLAAITVSPRTHVVDVTREGEVVARQELDVARGAASTVTLTIPVVETSVAVVSIEPEVSAPPPETDNDWLVWAAIGGGGVVLATILIVVIAVVTSGAEDPIAGTFQPGVLTW